MRGASHSIPDRFARKQSKTRSRESEAFSGPIIGIGRRKAMALGQAAPSCGKVTICREIDRVGAGAVVDGEVETIAAGPREMRAL